MKPLQSKTEQAKVLIALSPTCPYVICWIAKMLNISFNKCSEAKWSQQAWHLHLLFNHALASLFQMQTDRLEREREKKSVSLDFYQFVDIYYNFQVYCLISSLFFFSAFFLPHFSFFITSFRGSNEHRGSREGILQTIPLRCVWDKIRTQRIRLAWDSWSRDVSYHPDDGGLFCKTQSLQEYSHDWVVRGRATEEYIFVTWFQV